MELANNLKILVSTVKAVQISNGNGAGRDWKMGVFTSASHSFFLPHSCPLRPRKALPHPVKLYFLLICPTIITNFFNKNLFHNKNLFEIKIKFISSNQTNFYLKLNNII